MASRPSTAPDFLLSRAHGSVRTQGSRAFFRSIEDIPADLDAPLIVGALPFDPAAEAALTVPESVIWEPAALNPHAYYLTGDGSRLSAHVAGFDPSPEEHLRRVTEAVATLSADPDFEKVVLARAVDIDFDEPVDPRLIAARLIDTSAARDGFIVDLGGSWLVGCSPEMLVRKQGAEISLLPLAGSAPRPADPAADRATGQQLAASAKNRTEHAYVVEDIRASLEPITTSLTIPDTPQLISTNEVWHLATPITGTLADASLNALQLAAFLHPTPAICGTPTARARNYIQSVESDRRFYAGAVGWADNQGNGEFMVAIRCAEVTADGLHARAWAGGGIVADSDPAEELAETTAKLTTMMKALGL
ncbi:MAG: isochorismate synthase [Corynebacterium sp.]|nr:isochorismate synthase [Corynebacterium sp.]